PVSIRRTEFSRPGLQPRIAARINARAEWVKRGGENPNPCLEGCEAPPTRQVPNAPFVRRMVVEPRSQQIAIRTDIAFGNISSALPRYPLQRPVHARRSKLQRTEPLAIRHKCELAIVGAKLKVAICICPRAAYQFLACRR